VVFGEIFTIEAIRQKGLYMMKIMASMMKMKTLDDIWTELKAVQNKFDAMNELWHTFTTKTSTLIYKHEVERPLKSAKKQLIRKAIQLTLTKHHVSNITIQEEHIDLLMKQEFKQGEIEAFTIEHYVKDADSKAYNEMLKEVKHLVPNIEEPKYHYRKATVEDLVRKNKLGLRIYWSFESVSLDSLRRLKTLTKLIMVVTSDVKPSEVCLDHTIGDTVDSFRGSFSQPKNEARKYTYDKNVPILEGFRIYKNGKLEITFKKGEDALKMAKALVGEEQ